MADWTTGEVRYLNEHYGVISARAIALLLGRPVGGVIAKAYRLGIKSALVLCASEKIEVECIRDHITDGLAASEIAKIEGVSKRSVLRQSKKLHGNIRLDLLRAGRKMLKRTAKQRGVMPDDGRKQAQ